MNMVHRSRNPSLQNPRHRTHGSSHCSSATHHHRAPPYVRSARLCVSRSKRAALLGKIAIDDENTQLARAAAAAAAAAAAVDDERAMEGIEGDDAEGDARCGDGGGGTGDPEEEDKEDRAQDDDDGAKAEATREAARPASRHGSRARRARSSAVAAAAAAAEAAATSAPGACCICYRRKARVVFFPCHHLNACVPCAELLDECPVCRSTVEERHTVYW